MVVLSGEGFPVKWWLCFEQWGIDQPYRVKLLRENQASGRVVQALRTNVLTDLY